MGRLDFTWDELSLYLVRLLHQRRTPIGSCGAGFAANICQQHFSSRILHGLIMLGGHNFAADCSSGGAPAVPDRLICFRRIVRQE